MRYKESVAAQVTGGGGEAANSTTYGTLTGNGSAIMPPQIAVDGVVDGHATVLVMYDMNQGKYATLKATTRNGNAHLVPNGQLPTGKMNLFAAFHWTSEQFNEGSDSLMCGISQMF